MDPSGRKSATTRQPRSEDGLVVEAVNTLAGSHEGHTSIHEAGHAVAHVRLGILQSHATIEPLDSDLAGSVLADDSVWDRDDAENQVLSLYAGYAACLAAGRRNSLRSAATMTSPRQRRSSRIGA